MILPAQDLVPLVLSTRRYPASQTVHTPFTIVMQLLGYTGKTQKDIIMYFPKNNTTLVWKLASSHMLRAVTNGFASLSSKNNDRTS